VIARAPTPRISDGEFHCGEFDRDACYFTWRPAGCDDWLLIYTEAGSGRLGTAHGATFTQPGDVILYAPHEPQDYSTAPDIGRWHLLWAHFVPKPHWQAWLHWPAGENGLKLLRLGQSEVHQDFRAAMQRMVQLAVRPLPIAADRVRKAITYLSTHFREPFLLDPLARHCGLSVSRLAHLFKAQTGISPQRFLEQHRMQLASRLLRMTDFTVTEVAGEVGYPDPFYFSNRFRRYSGMSPNQFRARKRG